MHSSTGAAIGIHVDCYCRLHPVATAPGSDFVDHNATRKGPIYFTQTAIAKAQEREYTPCPHLPPLTIKVSQVEIEASDCEGRLPPLFYVTGSKQAEQIV